MIEWINAFLIIGAKSQTKRFYLNDNEIGINLSMDNKLVSKLTFNGVYEQIAKDLPILLLLKQNNDKIIDKNLINDSENYLDLLSKAFVVFDINPKELSSTEELVIICDKLMNISNKFELKRINQLMDKSIKDLKTDLKSFEDKFNGCVREMKSQNSFDSVMAEKIKFYSTKSKEYYECLKSKENTLSKIGFTVELKEESIQQIRDNNEELKIRLNDINVRLNEYKDFVPTETHLKNKLSEIKVQINELDHLFNNDNAFNKI